MRHTENQNDKVAFPTVVRQNDIVWENIYNKYASLMYGFILDITRDEKIAGEIYKENFIELSNKKSHRKLQKDICNRLLQHTRKKAAKYLKTVEKPGHQVPARSTNLPLDNLWNFINGYMPVQE